MTRNPRAVKIAAQLGADGLIASGGLLAERTRGKRAYQVASLL